MYFRTPNAQGPHLIVITGGPGAGKTALLELVRKNFCDHITIVPEAASILFGGGFPRLENLTGRKASQRAIFFVQRELERIALEKKNVSLILCDRGTVDGLAYWPGLEEEFWKDVGSSLYQELARYSAVIHLRTPQYNQGYNHQNPLRTENLEEALRIDEKILRAWEHHTKRFVVQSEGEFLNKVSNALDILQLLMPDCCDRRELVIKA